MDTAGSFASLHHRALVLLSASTGKSLRGLQQGVRFAKGLSKATARRLCELDTVAAWTRHHTEQKADSFLASLEAELLAGADEQDVGFKDGGQGRAGSVEGQGKDKDKGARDKGQDTGGAATQDSTVQGEITTRGKAVAEASDTGHTLADIDVAMWAAVELRDGAQWTRLWELRCKLAQDLGGAGGYGGHGLDPVSAGRGR